MTRDSTPFFYSKILLFGEYSLIVGSMALSIPFKNYGGRFVFNAGEENEKANDESNQQLEKFAVSLKNILQVNSSEFNIDSDAFFKDISSGLIFRSNIPTEYGLGSSGALVAAVFSKYGNVKVPENPGSEMLSALKEFLAKMESFYHGKSSGLDPLISLLNKPLLLDDSGEITIPVLPEWKAANSGALFLVDSESKSETQPLVDHFLDNCRNEEFMCDLASAYIPNVNACIEAYCAYEVEKMKENLVQLSDYQWKNFHPMIPGSVRKIWQQGLDSGNFTLKLCGSGGGGMVLGYSDDFERTKKELSAFRITKIHRI